MTVKTANWRGHEAFFDETVDAWRFSDDGTLVSEHFTERPCRKCEKKPTSEGHDFCIAGMPKVMNACCGHGDDKCAYIQYEDGKRVGGAEALRRQEKFRELNRKYEKFEDE